MIILIRFLLVALFAVVIFCRSYFPNDALYWCTYFLMFVLVAAFWYVSFWVSEKKAEKVLGKKPGLNLYCGKVSEKETDDLSRGRLCSVDGNLVLVGKVNNKYEQIFSVAIKDITSVGFGFVAGKRKGFTLYVGKKGVSFTSVKACKDKNIIYDMLGWKFEDKEEKDK